MAQYTHVLLILKTQHFNPSVYPRHDEPTRFLVDAFLTLLAPFFLFFFKILACVAETTNGQWPAWLGPNK